VKTFFTEFIVKPFKDMRESVDINNHSKEVFMYIKIFIHAFCVVVGFTDEVKHIIRKSYKIVKNDSSAYNPYQSSDINIKLKKAYKHKNNVQAHNTTSKNHNSKKKK
jgi:hypothetical protein